MSRLTKAIVVSILVLTLMPLSLASAQEYYARWDSVTNVDCTLTNITMIIARNRNFPASGGEAYWAWYINGSLDESGVDTYGGGSFTQTVSAGRTHVTPPVAFPYTAQIVIDTVIGGETVYRSQTTFTCPALGAGTAVVSNTAVTTTGGTGPDMVALPDGSVVGTFTTTTELYYAPNTDAATDTVMEIGKSLWVTGMDASGQFYQVVLSGKFLWVPVGTIGPTYDDVWNGAPLPTTMVN